MKRKVKKLVLNKETVRTLQDSQLRQVAAGRGLEVPEHVYKAPAPPSEYLFCYNPDIR